MAKRVMTVDDSPTVRQSLNHTLKRSGFQVVEAADGRKALDALNREVVDLLITDLNMPEMDGMDLIREVRRNPSNRFLPIIMLSSESPQENRQRSREVGASAWISKPFNPDQILAVVRMVIG